MILGEFCTDGASAVGSKHKRPCNLRPWATMVDHGRPWSTLVDHGRPWFFFPRDALQGSLVPPVPYGPCSKVSRKTHLGARSRATQGVRLAVPASAVTASAARQSRLLSAKTTTTGVVKTSRQTAASIRRERRFAKVEVDAGQLMVLKETIGAETTAARIGEINSDCLSRRLHSHQGTACARGRSCRCHRHQSLHRSKADSPPVGACSFARRLARSKGRGRTRRPRSCPNVHSR